MYSQKQLYPIGLTQKEKDWSMILCSFSYFMKREYDTRYHKMVKQDWYSSHSCCTTLKIKERERKFSFMFIFTFWEFFRDKRKEIDRKFCHLISQSLGATKIYCSWEFCSWQRLMKPTKFLSFLSKATYTKVINLLEWISLFGMEFRGICTLCRYKHLCFGNFPCNIM